LQLLQSISQAQQFYDENELTLAIDLLSKHQITVDLLGINPEQFPTQNLIQ
jgi:hypothetical protein